MNTKEIGELRRRARRDRSGMTAIYGCYVNDNQEIVCQFRQGTGVMPENEAEKYFGLFRRLYSGTLGKNLLDIRFETSQVAGSPEHQLLMDLRKTALEDETLRQELYQKLVESVNIGSAYLILLGYDRYDVPFKSGDGETQADRSDEVFTYLMCAVCPVKQANPHLQYEPAEKTFHDSGTGQIVAPPELGFVFPAFDDRATNIYNALYYTHSPKENYQAVAEAIFKTQLPKPAAEQKKSFEALLSESLGEECSMEVVQNVHDQLCQQIEAHKQSKVPEPLTVSKEQVREVISACGVSETGLAKFSVDYDEAFGLEAELHPKNIIDDKRFEIHTPDVSIRVDPSRRDLVETRIIGGVKYILISAEEDVEVNGVSIRIRDGEPAKV